MNLQDAIDTGKSIIALASTMRPVSLDFSGASEDEQVVNDILDELRVLRAKWDTIDQDGTCPDCGQPIEGRRESKWFLFSRLVYQCSQCGFHAASQDEYERRKAARIAETQGMAAAKFVALAGRLVTTIADGIASRSASLICEDVSALIMKPNESVILALPAILLTERAVRHTQTRQTSSPNRTYLGGSFRIARGAYVHFGGSVAQQRTSESASASVSELFPKDSGTFVLTTSRLMFIGCNLAATTLDLSRLVSVSLTEGQDGRQAIMFHVTNKQKPVIVLIQEVAFHPAGVPWPLLHAKLGISPAQIASRAQQLASHS